jgi:CheY-like chemotaxis protein
LWADPTLRLIPVVVLSADATPHLHQRLQTLGAAGYLTKPFIVKDVLETVDAHLEGTDGRT